MSFTLEEMEKYLTALRTNYLEFYNKFYPTQLKIVKNNDINVIEELMTTFLGEGGLA